MVIFMMCPGGDSENNVVDKHISAVERYPWIQNIVSIAHDALSSPGDHSFFWEGASRVWSELTDPGVRELGFPIPFYCLIAVETFASY